MELSRGCYVEFEFCYGKYDGNLEEIKKVMECVSVIFIQCYEGDCSLCNDFSFVCGFERDKFWEKSYFFKDYQIFFIDEDKI